MNASTSRIRLAFVGQANYFDFVSLSTPTTSLEPTFIDFRSRGSAEILFEKIRDFDPEVIIVFRPEIIPPGLLTDLDAVRVGWFTEPIAQVSSRTELEQVHEDNTSKLPSQVDLERRLIEASSCDVQQFDRLISHDPLLAPTLELFGPIWRSVPLAVDDRFFRDPADMRSRPRIGFIGSSTPYRESFLAVLKHDYDLRHFAHGLFGDRLLDQLGDLDVAVNLHHLDISNFENRVSLHLAQGHLLLSQSLSPTHGLEANRDFIEFRSPSDLAHIVSEIHNFPHSHELIRQRGRLKAEYFRASTVYEKIVRELMLEQTQ